MKTQGFLQEEDMKWHEEHQLHEYDYGLSKRGMGGEGERERGGEGKRKDTVILM